MSISRNSLSRATFILIILLIVAFSSLSLAQNDPGHDTLYIEQEGDSELTGNLNVTGNVSIEGIIYSGSDLDVRGDSVQASGSNNQIIGTSSILSIQSIGDLYINTFQGTTSTVYLGDGASDSVNINITGALYFGSNGRLAVSSGNQAGSSLYWGDKLICNASQSNCGWVTSTTGGGDITSVQSDNVYIYNGSDSGAVYLLFNETKLNATIDSRATSLGGDGNNYTTSAGVTSSGLTKTIQIAILGRDNVTASFVDNNTDTTYSNGTGLALSGTTFSLAAGVITPGSYGNNTAIPVCTYDTYGRATSCTNTSINFPATATDQNNYTTSIVITGTATKNITLTRQGMINISATFDDLNTGNCSAQYSCGAIMYAGNMTGYLNTSTGNTYINVTTGANYHTIFLNSSTGNTKINTSTYGPSGITAGKYGNSTIVPVCTYDIYGRATSCTNTSISFPEQTWDGTGGWTNNSQNTSTTLNVGIGDTTPEAILDVQSTSGINQLRVSFDDSNFGNISVNSGGNMTIKATGHVIIDLS